MRHINSKRKGAKKQKRNQIIASIFLASILFASIFGYAFGGQSSEENEITYEGYDFTEKNGYWFVDISNFEFSFRYNPNEIEEINADLNFLNSYYEKPLYISSEDIESESEIYRNLLDQNSIIQRMQLACLEGEECENEELPIKTCESNFIIIQEAEAISITQEDGCVFIQGPVEELTKITDSFLLKIIGVQ